MQLLARLPNADPRQVLSTILESSQLAQGVRGQEERDLLFSRLFGIHAVLASGLLFRPIATLHDWRTAIEECLYLGERRAWLRESAGWIVQIATKRLLQAQEVTWRLDGLQAVLTAAFARPSEPGASQEFTPEKLALAILLQEANIQADWDKLLQPTFSHAEILSSADNLPVIARLLRVSDSLMRYLRVLKNGFACQGLAPSENAKKANEQAQSIFFGNGQLHYVWQAILEAYFPERSSEKPQKNKAKAQAGAHAKIPFVDLYNSVAEEHLLGSSSAVSSKYVGLVAFEACFSAASADIAPRLLGANLVRTLVNHLSKGDRTLNSVCQRIARTIPGAVKAKPEMGVPVLMRLFEGEHGTFRFDALTHTKTVESIVASLDELRVQEYSSWLMHQVIEPDTRANGIEGDDAMDIDGQADIEMQRKASDSKRSWAIDQLLLLIRKHSTALPQEVTSQLPDWTVRIVEFLALHAFFTLQKASKKSSVEALRRKPEPPLSSAVQSLCASRLFSAVAHLVTINPRCKGQVWTKKVLETLQALEADTKHVSPLFDAASGTERQPLLQALARVQKVSLFKETILCGMDADMSTRPGRRNRLP